MCDEKRGIEDLITGTGQPRNHVNGVITFTNKNPAIAAGQILNDAGLPIDVKKVFEMADWCDEPVEEEGQ